MANDYHDLLQRVASVEVEIEALKLATKNPVNRNAKLEIVARKTVEVLRQWRDDKATMLGEEGYEDYSDVIATLPMLESALGMPITKPTK